MQLGERAAENLKKELGHVGGDAEGSTEIVGKQLTDGLAKAVEITSAEVGEALEPIVTEIVEAVRRAIEESKPDVTADIYQTGLILTGGGALLGGMAERLQKELRLHVAVADDPLGAVALGAGRLLTSKARLQRVAIREDIPVWESEQALVVNW
jgi:rod shape-determining protein MreB